MPPAPPKCRDVSNVKVIIATIAIVKAMRSERAFCD
jgi:hypothetical protein